MQLVFTRGSGKYDDLAVTRADGTSERVQCPKQGMIPHDMVHFAVESVLHGQGFLAGVADGGGLGFDAGAGPAAEAIERLVETMQADIWSMQGQTPLSELLGLYDLGCAARGHPALPVSADDIAAIRARMADLAAQWDAVPVGGTLRLSL